MKSLKSLLLVMFLSSVCFANPSAPTRLSTVLAGHVHEGKVDYQAIREERSSELRAFVKSLATALPDSMTHEEQVAFWLDAYNGLVVYQVIDKDAAPDSKRARAKFFRGRRYEVAGKSMTLDDIEHKALRPLAKDPRVHFVLVCGAQSCPSLSASSFLGAESLNDTLEQATETYINNPKNVEIDQESKTLTLNKIFDWYADDFGDVVAFVAKYRSPKEQKALASGSWKIEYRDYDWDLNRAKD